MELNAALGALLVVAGLWNLVVWPPFLRRVLKDPRARDDAGKATKFLVVHVVLVTVSMALGLAVAVVGLAAIV